MHTDPVFQTKLIGYELEFKKMKSYFLEKKIPNRIIFSGKKGIGKTILAYHLINFILSINEDNKYDSINNIINKNNRSFRLVSKNIHPNLFVIDLKTNKSSIDISQIREMYKFTDKSSFDNNAKIVLINNSEFLNINSSNSLLKILEDENPNIFFILIHDIKKKIIETIKSRCIVFNLKLKNNFRDEIINDYIKNKHLANINKDFINYYSSPGDVLNYCNFCIENNLDYEKNTIEFFLKKIISSKVFFNHIYIKTNISFFIELYFYKKLINNKNDSSFFILYRSFIKKINLFKKYNLDLETLLIDFNTVLLNE